MYQSCTIDSRSSRLAQTVIELNQYYTPESTSLALASMLDISNVRSCIELSAGEGALVGPLKASNKNIKFTTVDIDQSNSTKLANLYPNDVHICGDALDKNIGLKNDSFDLAICNPPFSYVDNSDKYSYLLTGKFGTLLSKNKRLRMEVLFILRNLQLLKPGGTLAVIVPDFILNSRPLLNFRRILFDRFELFNVVECGYGSFKKTEAKTYILFIKKVNKCKFSKVVPVISIVNGVLKKNSIDIENAIKTVEKVEPNSGYEIFRGCTSSKLCRESRRDFHHNYSGLENFSNVTYKVYSAELPKFKYAKFNDVLINRVGRNVGDTVILASSNVIVSDCVIVIRFHRASLREAFIENWTRDRADWIKLHVKGTCAKNISISSIKSYISTLGKVV